MNGISVIASYNLVWKYCVGKFLYFVEDKKQTYMLLFGIVISVFDLLLPCEYFMPLWDTSVLSF